MIADPKTAKKREKKEDPEIKKLRNILRRRGCPDDEIKKTIKELWPDKKLV